jgi:hypothetical protein
MSILLCKFLHAQESSNEGASVYFMRSTGASGLGAFNAFIDDSLVCKLNNNCYSVHNVTSGQHIFQVRADGAKPKKKNSNIVLQIEPGQSYYFTLNVTNHMYTATLMLVEVTVNTAKKMLPALKEDKHCK